MNKNFLKKTAVFVIFMFGFFLLSESFPTGPANRQSDKEPLQQGEELYKNGEYEKALTVFEEAEPYITDTNKRLILYFHLSLTHFALGNSNQTEESLRKLFGLAPGYSIIEENYPRGFIKIFNQIKAEIKAKIDAERRAKEKEKRQKKVIEKPKPKAPGKKKKFPLLLVLGGAAVAFLAILLLSNKKEGSSQPIPEVRDPNVQLRSKPSGAKVYADGEEISSSTPAEFTLSPGQHLIRLKVEGFGEAKNNIDFENSKTYNIYVELAAYTYEFVTKWGSEGNGDNQFRRPTDVAVDNNGFLYITDTGNYRILKFESNGNFVSKWGSFGWGNNNFRSPYDIAVRNNYVFVTDGHDNHRVQKFDSNGKYVTKWGSKGSADSQFEYPSGIAVDKDGYVFVSDFGNHRIQKFDFDGNFIKKWGELGSGDGQFSHPSGVAVDYIGYVYVIDDTRIQKFDSEGNFIAILKTGSALDLTGDNIGYLYIANSYCISKLDLNGDIVTVWGSKGNGDGEFGDTDGIAVDNDGNVYVVEKWNHRIQKFKMSNQTGDDGRWYIDSTLVTNTFKVSTPVNSNSNYSRKDKKRKNQEDVENKRKL